VWRALAFLAVLVLAAMATTVGARAADKVHGQRLAQQHCAACHIVGRHGRNEVADAPPFTVIGREYDFDPGVIARVIAGPHPKMNFAPRGADAADIAAYIATLKH
jgi:mono/diheme cytochrome c family protein